MQQQLGVRHLGPAFGDIPPRTRKITAGAAHHFRGLISELSDFCTFAMHYPQPKVPAETQVQKSPVADSRLAFDRRRPRLTKTYDAES